MTSGGYQHQAWEVDSEEPHVGSRSLTNSRSDQKVLLAQDRKEVVQQRLRRMLSPTSRPQSSSAKLNVSISEATLSPKPRELGEEPLSPMSPKRLRHLQDARAKEQDWWSYTRRLQTDAPSKFKFPPDPYSGQDPPEEKIIRQARLLERQQQAQVAKYRLDIEKMHKEQWEKIGQKRRLERSQAKSAPSIPGSFEGQKQQRKEAEQNYKAWLTDTSENVGPKVACRPVSAPGSLRWDKNVQRKVEAARSAQEKELAEYKAWLKAAQKPSFTLPKQAMLTPEQREAFVTTQAKSARDKAAAVEKEYKTMVKEFEKKHEERVKEEREAEDEWRQEHDELINKLCVASKNTLCQRQKEFAEKDADLLLEIHQRVKSRPLLVEENSIPSTPMRGRAFPHRRPDGV